MKKFTSFSVSASVWRLLLSVLLLLAFGMQGQAAELKGKVTVNNARPLADALVKVHEAGSKRLVVTRTGGDGNYVVQNLTEGRYLLEIEKHGRLLYQGFVDITGGTTVKNVILRQRS